MFNDQRNKVPTPDPGSPSKDAGQPCDAADTELLRIPKQASITNRLKLYFAVLSCLGGLVLSSGQETNSLPVVAVFFSVFGYVFVDWLRLFALPPVAAYAAMTLAALYCVSDFTDLDSPGNRQMIAVSELLVFVQAILMLQSKTRRIFEQLGVFCLLELIVAAVFNNAIYFGLLLVPICVVGSWALCLLSALSASEGLEESSDEPIRRVTDANATIQVSASESIDSLTRSAIRLPRVSLLTLAPSVLLVGIIFFYALPRTTDAARMGNRGDALVGFSEMVRLEQIGHMLQSSKQALHCYLSEQSTGRPYRVVGGLYLRGRVLEQYRPDINDRAAYAIWSSLSLGPISGGQPLPKQFLPARNSDSNFYDLVNVQVTCEAMRSKSLFAVAPYHRLNNNPGITHSVDRWTISRRANDDWVQPRLTYSFGTHAFSHGIQLDLTSRWAKGEAVMAPSDQDAPTPLRSVDENRPEVQRRSRKYMDELLAFDSYSMPTAKRLAESVTNAIPEPNRTQYAIAKRLERFLAIDGGFSYTLNLNAESIPGLDPIEQFLSTDRRGHCQYFASALVMMLRSQGIPSRIVVGYQTDEYNELGQYYVARQLHAHAWVEALIPRDQLEFGRIVYGQPRSEEYWLRLDPTPGGGGVDSDMGGGVGQVFDLAQNIWDDYVIDMDARRQDEALNTPGLSPMSDSYVSFIKWVGLKISRIQEGQLGGGALARREFSWPAAIFGMAVTLTALVLFRLRVPVWGSRRHRRKSNTAAAVPSLPFYAEVTELLSRVGIHRQAAQTPAELSDEAARRLSHPMIPSLARPLGILTSAFYRLRFGPNMHHRDQRKLHSEVDEALSQLRTSVNLMTINSGRSEQKL